jgi:MFS family permease
MVSLYHPEQTSKEYVKLETEISGVLSFMTKYRSNFIVGGTMGIILLGLCVAIMDSYQLPWRQSVIGTILAEVVWDVFCFMVIFTMVIGLLCIFGQAPFTTYFKLPVHVALIDSVKTLSLWISERVGIKAFFTTAFYYYIVMKETISLFLEYINPKGRLKYIVLIVAVGVYVYAYLRSLFNFGNSTLIIIHALYLFTLLQNLINNIKQYKITHAMQRKLYTVVPDSEIIGNAIRGGPDNF